MMTRARNLRRFLASDNGLNALEYATTLVFIAALILGTMSTFGIALHTTFLTRAIGL
jgi:Flp pilus assembly pilin Flp